MALAAITAMLAFAQPAQIAHFVSPSYPPLARQAGISGQARVGLILGRDGAVTATSEESSTHPLLGEEVKRSVEHWVFAAAERQRKISVIVYFGFAGEPRDIDPNTTVTADFDESLVRVYVTTSPAPAVRP
jgi:TonB family protein